MTIDPTISKPLPLVSTEDLIEAKKIMAQKKHGALNCLEALTFLKEKYNLITKQEK